VVEDGYSPLVFPEGRHSMDETVARFQPGAAMMAVRLGLPVVPLRVRGSNRVLHPRARMARPAFVSVKIGAPLHLEGEDFPALAARLEAIIKGM
jgi:1-acyl-sn-glycerol-3-phosphate acyltransferase